MSGILNANDIYKCQNNFESISDTPSAQEPTVVVWLVRSRDFEFQRVEYSEKIVYLYASAQVHTVSRTHTHTQTHAHRTLQRRRLLMGTATVPGRGVVARAEWVLSREGGSGS